jgi:hypothetical protein
MLGVVAPFLAISLTPKIAKQSGKSFKQIKPKRYTTKKVKEAILLNFADSSPSNVFREIG